MATSPHGRSRCLIPILLLLVFASCVEPVQPDSFTSDTEGYSPVYEGREAAEVKWLSPRTVNNPGKIYVYGQYLLINEAGKGIHVYDNTESAAPEPLGFIQILGNTDMAIKDNRLYADHLGNLLHIAIANLSSIEEKGKLPLQDWALGVPPPTGSYFECVDPAKGIVVSWRKSKLKTADCYAIQ